MIILILNSLNAKSMQLRELLSYVRPVIKTKLLIG
ncbi:MAG: hypothetical protein JWM59_772 [Verrucomicrobiales bacterium]|nr:hypothetical protein [Verrucomicrobiales bacterium]